MLKKWFLRTNLVLTSKVILALVTFFLLLALPSHLNLASTEAQGNASPSLGNINGAPYQTALLQLFNERRSQGLPAPALSAIQTTQTTRSDRAPFVVGAHVPETITTVTTTTIHFDGPEQLGYERWPSIRAVVEGENETTGGDFESEFRAVVESTIPELFDEYEYGTEPRTYSVTETSEVLYYMESASSGISPSLDAGMNATSKAQILTGFTFAFEYKYEITDSIEICFLACAEASFSAKLAFGIGLGMRIPFEVTLEGPSEIGEGREYMLTSTVNRLDWDEADFDKWDIFVKGDADEEGNEYLMFLETGISVTGTITAPFVEITVCEDCEFKIFEDNSASFETPFDGQTFDLGTIFIPIYKFNFSIVKFELGIGITPKIGSNLIKAEWETVSGCTGSGTVEYTKVGEPVEIGPITAGCLKHAPEAVVQLKNFLFVIDQLELELSAELNIDVEWKEFSFLNIEVSIPFYTLDVSDIFGHLPEIALGQHYECSGGQSVIYNSKLEEVDREGDLSLPSCGPKGPPNIVEFRTKIIADSRPQTFIALDGLHGDNGWYITPVTVTLTARDGLPECPGEGVDYTEYSFDGSTWMTYTEPFVISDEGITTIYYRSMDVIGNLEETNIVTVKVDTRKPDLSAQVFPAPNQFGWNNTDVIVDFTASDPLPGSGLQFVTPDVVLTEEGANQSVDAVAKDYAGWETHLTVDNINIDKTAPFLVINSPQSGEYPNTETITFDWDVSDNLSGIASVTAMIGTTPISDGEVAILLLFPAGDHQIYIEAVDKADNVTIKTVDIHVSVDLPGLQAALNYMCEIEGWATSNGACNGLNAKLNAAMKSLDKCKLDVVENQLFAFINQLHAQNEKGLTSEAYNVLYIDALYVLAHLPECEESVIAEVELVTEAPAIEVVATDAPATEVVATEEPVIEVVATEEPVIEVVATEEPVTEVPPTETEDVSNGNSDGNANENGDNNSNDNAKDNPSNNANGKGN